MGSDTLAELSEKFHDMADGMSREEIMQWAFDMYVTLEITEGVSCDN